MAEAMRLRMAIAMTLIRLAQRLSTSASRRCLWLWPLRRSQSGSCLSWCAPTSRSDRSAGPRHRARWRACMFVVDRLRATSWRSATSSDHSVFSTPSLTPSPTCSPLPPSAHWKTNKMNCYRTARLVMLVFNIHSLTVFRVFAVFEFTPVCCYFWNLTFSNSVSVELIWTFLCRTLSYDRLKRFYSVLF